ncbi:MAG: CdaR family protein [candidate division WOR-3 bacterium]
MRRGWGMRFLALFLAISLWFYAKTQRTYDIRITIPVEYKGLSRELSFVEPPDTEVVVDLTVRGGSLLGLMFVRPRIVVDLSRVRLGKNTITIGPSNLDSRGLNLGIKEFRPPELEFFLDTLARKKPSVVPQIKGEPENGYVVAGIRAMGSPVVEGPGTLLVQTREIYTEPVNIQGKSSGFRASTKLIPPFPTARLFPQEVEVEVAIEPLSEKTTTVPVILEGKRARFSPDSVKITIEGPASLIRTFSGTVGKIKTDTLRAGTYYLIPEIRLPKELRLVRMEPDKVEVKLW